VLPGVSFVNEARISDPQDATPGNNISRVVVGAQHIYVPFVARQYPTLQTRIFSSSGDAGIMQGFPTTNTGAEVVMKVGYDSPVPYSCPGWGDALTSRGLVKFDISTLPVNSVTQATLYLYNGGGCRTSNVTHYVLSAYRVTSAWNEGTVTWANAPGYAESYGSVYIPTGTEFIGTYRAIDVTGLVNAWLQGTPNHGVMVRGYEYDDAYNQVIEIYQNGTGNDPLLEVVYYGPSP
jgi:hypothetical protein